MSSKSKGKRPEKSVTSDWSVWSWDKDGYYTRYRTVNGEYEWESQYELPTQQTPRTTEPVAVSSNYPASDLPYHRNSDYSFESLTDGFAGTSISDAQRPQPIHSISYGDPAASTALDIVQPSRSTSSDHGYSMSAPPATGTGGFGGRETAFDRNMGQGSAIPEEASWPSNENDSSYTGIGLYSVPPAGPASSSAVSPYESSSGPHTSAQQTGGINRTRKFLSTDKGNDVLHKSYTIHNSSNFKPGSVFKIVWSEPKGDTADRRDDNGATVITDGHARVEQNQYGTDVYTSIRRFVVVKSGHGHSQCVPILTYGYQATSKNGVQSKTHAIVYAADCKEPTPRKLETGLLTSIKVKMRGHREKLDPRSRIQYAKIYTIEHNIKVHFIGEVVDKSWGTFMTDFDATWAGEA